MNFDNVKIPRKIAIDVNYNLECEWKNCGTYFSNITYLVLHLKEHILQEVENANLAFDFHKDIHSNSPCLWRNCNYYGKSSCDIVRHILFHTHHSKLKALGRNLIDKLQFYNCAMDSFSCNLLPEQLERPICHWNNCEYLTEDYENYYNHIQGHLDGCQLISILPDKFLYLCKWNECQYTTKFKIKLKDHLRSHTHEKLIACPECGSLYSNKTKFLDHIKRQIVHESHSFHCNVCNKPFSSTKLLKQHQIYHESTFKCPFCPFIASTVANVKKHVLYKHQNERPFHCPTCPFACKSQYDLQKHMDIHEAPGDLCACTIDDSCDFQCKNNVTLEKHIKKVHLNGNDKNAPRPNYICHLCDKKYMRTDKLCHHLKKKHQLDPYPQRFKYELYEDGNYRIKYPTLSPASLLQIQGPPQAVTNDPEMSKIGQPQQTSSHDVNYNGDAGNNSSGILVENVVVNHRNNDSPLFLSI